MSKERRDLEREKERERSERVTIANRKKEKTLNNINNKKKQTKITEMLNSLPENRRILAEKEAEKERILSLKEAKLELWRRWRHKKGKKSRFPNQTRLKEHKDEELDKKLAKIEEEVKKFEKEQQEATILENNK